MRNLLFILLLGALLPGCARRSSSDDYTQQVRNQLRAGGDVYAARGYSQTHQAITGSLDDGEAVNHNFDFDRGVDYQILGACDTDCTDLDFTLYDSNGNEVDEDVGTDDVPIVSATVSRAGRYRVRVTMADCDVAPCRYGVAIYGR